MAFKFYCLKCGHSEYISGNQPRVCSNCGWHSGQDAKPILVQLIEGDPTPAGARQGEMLTNYPTSDGRKWNELNRDEQWEEFKRLKIGNTLRQKELDSLRAENAKLQTQINSVVTLWNNRQETIKILDAENAKLRAAMNNHGLWMDFRHLANVLNDIKVTGWLEVHARALGSAIGYFDHLQNILDGKED